MNITLYKNIFAKICALLFAVFLWFFVMNEQNPPVESTFTVPLEVTNNLEGYSVDYNIENVKIKVRSQRNALMFVSETSFKAYVDLAGHSEGRQSLKIQVVLPQGFELVAVTPENLSIDIEKIINKAVPVDITLSGVPASGVSLGKALPATSEVYVEGPQSAVNSVKAVLGYINLAGKAEDFSIDVPLIAVNNEGKEVSNVKVIPRSVNVDISLVKGLYKKTVDIKTKLGNDLLADYMIKSIRTEPEKIDIYGDQRIVDKIEAIDTETIALANIDKDIIKEVKLELPVGINVIKDKINVHISVEKKKQ